MAENNVIKGTEGEKIAEDYLIGCGYMIIEKNWRYKHLEIDVIAQHNNTLVIIEVKQRSNNYFGNPEDFVTKAKQKKLIKAASEYIKINNCDFETRFDVIAIIKNESETIINHIIDAYKPGLK